MADPALWFPGARLNQLAPVDGGSILGGRPKMLWHDTETLGFPSYSTGFFPHMTINPVTGETRQHIPANRAARALRNETGGVQTNRFNVFQIEVLGFANQVRFHPVMGEVARWARDQLGVPLREGVVWRPYPSSFGEGNGVRLSAAQWNDYAGHLGHQHVPENHHGDPGFPFPIDQILAGAQPTPTPDLPRGDDMFILRCDKTDGTDGRPLMLVNAQRRTPISNAERSELRDEGVGEHNLTGHPALYDQVARTAPELTT